MATSVLPDDFFDDLDIPAAQKKFAISHHFKLKRRLEAIEQHETNQPKTMRNTTAPPTTAAETKEKKPRVQKPRPLPPSHLRCLCVKKAKSKSAEPERCKRNNKLSHDATPNDVLKAFETDGTPGEVLFCVSHPKSNCAAMENALEHIRHLVRDTKSTNEDNEDNDDNDDNEDVDDE